MFVKGITSRGSLGRRDIAFADHPILVFIPPNMEICWPGCFRIWFKTDGVFVGDVRSVIADSVDDRSEKLRFLGGGTDIVTVVIKQNVVRGTASGTFDGDDNPRKGQARIKFIVECKPKAPRGFMRRRQFLGRLFFGLVRGDVGAVRGGARGGRIRGSRICRSRSRSRGSGRGAGFAKSCVLAGSVVAASF